MIKYAMRGKFGEKPYDVIGLTELKSGLGFNMKFIVRDPKNRDGKVIGKVFLPSGMAKVAGELILKHFKKDEKR